MEHFAAIKKCHTKCCACGKLPARWKGLDTKVYADQDYNRVKVLWKMQML